MNLKHLLPYLWKLPLSGFAFYLGVVLGSIAALRIGLQAPALPAGTDEATLTMYLLLASLVLALTLSFISKNIQGGFVTRWLILSSLTWVAYAVNTYLEASIFTSFSAVSTFTVLMFFVASFLCGVVIAFLFPPQATGSCFATALKTFFGYRHTWDWTWRLLAASVAFAPIYLFFGWLVAPLTATYYRQSQFELNAPEWAQILPLLVLRSLLFLLACLPVLVTWRPSRRRLVFTLGLALFVLVGLLYMIQAYWFPWNLRAFHSLEILADSLVYAWVLVALLVNKPIRETSGSMTRAGLHCGRGLPARPAQRHPPG